MSPTTVLGRTTGMFSSSPAALAREVKQRAERAEAAIGATSSSFVPQHVLFGGFEAGDPGHFLMSIPEIVWELSLGVYLIVKGFRPSPILSAPEHA